MLFKIQAFLFFSSRRGCGVNTHGSRIFCKPNINGDRQKSGNVNWNSMKKLYETYKNAKYYASLPRIFRSNSNFSKKEESQHSHPSRQTNTDNKIKCQMRLKASPKQKSGTLLNWNGTFVCALECAIWGIFSNFILLIYNFVDNQAQTSAKYENENESEHKSDERFERKTKAPIHKTKKKYI